MPRNYTCWKHARGENVSSLKILFLKESFFVGSKHGEYYMLKSFFKSLENLINFVFKDVVGLDNLEQFFFLV